MRLRQSGRILAFLLVVGFLAMFGCAAENPLIGRWKQDNDRTLREFKLPTQGSEQLKSDAARAKRFIEAKIRIHSNVTLTYTNKECTEVIFGSGEMVLSNASFPYRIVETGKGYVVVDQMNEWGKAKAFFVDGAFYVEVPVGEFAFRDYFTRIKKE